MDAHTAKSSATEQIDPVPGDVKDLPSNGSSPIYAAPEPNGIGDGTDGGNVQGNTAEEIQTSRGGWFAYLKTRDFYLVLLLG